MWLKLDPAVSIADLRRPSPHNTMINPTKQIQFSCFSSAQGHVTEDESQHEKYTEETQVIMLTVVDELRRSETLNHPNRSHDFLHQKTEVFNHIHSVLVWLQVSDPAEQQLNLISTESDDFYSYLLGINTATTPTPIFQIGN